MRLEKYRNNTNSFQSREAISAQFSCFPRNERSPRVKKQKKWWRTRKRKKAGGGNERNKSSSGRSCAPSSVAVLSARFEYASGVHLRLNYARVINLRVSSRTFARARAYNRKRSCRAFDLRQAGGRSSWRGRIRVTLNDLFDPVGRTYICKISRALVLRTRIENVFPCEMSKIRNFQRRQSRAIDSRLILNRRARPDSIRSEPPIFSTRITEHRVYPRRPIIPSLLFTRGLAGETPGSVD